MKINFNKTDDYNGNTLVPAGKYKMRVRNLESTTTKRKGKTQLRCEMEILDNPEYEGMTKQEYFPLDENALWKIKQFIASLTDVSKLKYPEVDIDSIVFMDMIDGCIGNSLYIYYGVETFEGLERNYSRRYEKVKDGLELDPVPKVKKPKLVKDK